MIAELVAKGYRIVYTDGSSKRLGHKDMRRAGGFGVFTAEDEQAPEVRFCGYVPTRHRQTNDGAELLGSTGSPTGVLGAKTGNPHRLTVPATGSDWQGPTLEVKGMDNHVW